MGEGKNRFVVEDEIDSQRLREQELQRGRIQFEAEDSWIVPQGGVLARSSWFIERVVLGASISASLRLLTPFRDWLILTIVGILFFVISTHWKTRKSSPLWTALSLTLLIVSGSIATLRSFDAPLHKPPQQHKAGQSYQK